MGLLIHGFFFSGIELHDLWLIESTGAKWQTQRADYEVMHVFSDAVGQLP